MKNNISPDFRNYNNKCENSILGQIVYFQNCANYPYIFSLKMPNFSFELLNFSGFNTIWDDNNSINLKHLSEEVSIFCWVFAWSCGCRWENGVPVWWVQALYAQLNNHHYGSSEDNNRLWFCICTSEPPLETYVEKEIFFVFPWPCYCF